MITMHAKHDLSEQIMMMMTTKVNIGQKQLLIKRNWMIQIRR